MKIVFVYTLCKHVPNLKYMIEIDEELKDMVASALRRFIQTPQDIARCK